MAGSTYHEGPGDRIELEYAVPHPKYDPDTLDLDASLVKMARMPLYGILPIKVNITEVFFCVWSIQLILLLMF